MRNIIKQLNLLQQYTQANPKDAGLWARLGDAHFSNKDIDNAMKAYKKSLSLDGSNVEATKRLATVYSLANDTKNSETFTKKSPFS